MDIIKYLASPFVRAAVIPEQRQTWGIIRGSVRSLVSSPSSPRVETFEGACERLGLDEAKLARRHKEFAIEVTLFGAIGLAVLIYSLTLTWYAGFAGVMVGVMILTRAWQSAFRAWQIRCRRLGSVGEFMAHPSQIWPWG